MFNAVLHEFFSRHSCLLDDALAIAGTKKLFMKLFRENWRYGRLWVMGLEREECYVP
jgi:hypothetical protein